LRFVREFHWTLEQVGQLSWGQIDEIALGLKELDETTPDKETPSEDLAKDVDYQNQMARLLLGSKKPDGTVDLNALMGKLRPPGPNG